MKLEELLKKAETERAKSIKGWVTIIKEWFGEENVEIADYSQYKENANVTVPTIADYINNFRGIYNIRILPILVEYALKEFSLHYNHYSSIPEFENSIVLNSIMEQVFDALPYRVTIRFPKVMIANENNESHLIKDLFISFFVSSEGKCMERTLSMGRQTFTYSELRVGYLHSHYPIVRGASNLIQWLRPCLGSGPIKKTMQSLSTRGYFKSTLWYLFYCELNKYVCTESLSGIPYISLKKVSNAADIVQTEENQCTDTYSSVLNGIIDSYTKWLIRSVSLPFNFINGKIDLAMNNYDFIIFLTQHLKEFTREDTSCKKWNITEVIGMLVRKVDTGSSFIMRNTQTDDFRGATKLDGTSFITFNGEDLKIKVEGISEGICCSVINPSIARYIRAKIVSIVNYYYYERKNGKKIEKSKKGKKLKLTNTEKEGNSNAPIWWGNTPEVSDRERKVVIY